MRRQTTDSDEYSRGNINHTIKPNTEYYGKIIAEYSMPEFGPDYHCLVLGIDGAFNEYGEQEKDAIEMIATDNFLACYFNQRVKVVLGDCMNDDTWARIIKHIELDEAT